MLTGLRGARPAGAQGPGRPRSGRGDRVGGGRPCAPPCLRCVLSVSVPCGTSRPLGEERVVYRACTCSAGHRAPGAPPVDSRFRFNAFHPDTHKPMHRECGFIRLEPDTNKVAFVSAQNTGTRLPRLLPLAPCRGPCGHLWGGEAAGGAVGAPLPEQAGSWLSAPTHVCASPMFPVRVGLRWGDLDRE